MDLFRLPKEKEGSEEMKVYFCKECAIIAPTKYRTYLTKEALLADHPTLKNHPELIGEMEEEVKK